MVDHGKYVLMGKAGSKILPVILHYAATHQNEPCDQCLF